MGIYDVPVNELINNTANELKSFDSIAAPVWTPFVKTGVHKEKPPVNGDWWHIRVAAVLLSVAKRGPLGVNRLRVKYGGKKNRGMAPARFAKGSGNIARKVLQQLEKSGLVKQETKGTHKGRVLTGEGLKVLSKVSDELMKVHKIEFKKVEKKDLSIAKPKKTAVKKSAKKKSVKKASKKSVKTDEVQE